MSITNDQKIIRDGTADGHQPLAEPAAASTNLYAGTVAVLYKGYLVDPSTPSSDQVVIGMLNGLIDGSPHVTAPMASTLAGDHILGVDTGSFWLKSGASADALTQANVGSTVYLIDGVTVGATNGSSTRPAAGTLNRIGSGPYTGFVSVRLNPAGNP